MDGVHKEFQKVIGAAVCRYVPERGVLLAISRHESIRRHSTMLQEMHFRNLSQKVIYFSQIRYKIIKRIRIAANQLYYQNGGNLFFSSLYYLFVKVLLLKRTEEAARQLESTKLQTVGV